MSVPSRHLVVVAPPVQPVRQDDTPAHSAEILLLEPILRERFRVREVDNWPDGVTRSTGARIPFAILVTAEQVLEVAADADFRAEILDDIANAHVKGRAQHDPVRSSIGTGHRRAIDLREVAADLRRIAAALVDD